MTVYSTLLRLTLDQEGDGSGLTIAELVSDALSCRARLIPSAGAARSSRRQEVADRIGDSLAYDAALVRLCQRLSVEQELTGDVAGPEARRSAEMGLSERLPTIAGALAGSLETRFEVRRLT